MEIKAVDIEKRTDDEKKKRFAVICQWGENKYRGVQFFENEEKAKMFFERSKNYGFDVLGIAEIGIIIEYSDAVNYLFNVYHVEAKKEYSIKYYNIGCSGGIFRYIENPKNKKSYSMAIYNVMNKKTNDLLALV